MKIVTKIEIDGKEYDARVGRISSSHLGFEDHGVNTVNVNFDFDGSGIGIGHIVIDERSRFADKGSRKRSGTAYGLDLILQIIEIVGCADWEHLVGNRVYVLFTPNTFEPMRGIANLMSENSLVFADHSSAWRSLEAEAYEEVKES